jgi:hypothetical protein
LAGDIQVVVEAGSVDLDQGSIELPSILAADRCAWQPPSSSERTGAARPCRADRCSNRRRDDPNPFDQLSRGGLFAQQQRTDQARSSVGPGLPKCGVVRSKSAAIWGRPAVALMHWGGSSFQTFRNAANKCGELPFLHIVVL